MSFFSTIIIALFLVHHAFILSEGVDIVPEYKWVRCAVGINSVSDGISAMFSIAGNGT